MNAIQAYLAYVVSSFTLLSLFSIVYTKMTRYNEWQLIKEGNIAAALSFGGALLGFSLTLFSTIVTHANWTVFIVWSLGAMLVQLLTYQLVARLLLPGFDRAITNNNVAKGALIASISICVGLINAACVI